MRKLYGLLWTMWLLQENIVFFGIVSGNRPMMRLIQLTNTILQVIWCDSPFKNPTFIHMQFFFFVNVGFGLQILKQINLARDLRSSDEHTTMSSAKSKNWGRMDRTLGLMMKMRKTMVRKVLMLRTAHRLWPIDFSMKSLEFLSWFKSC